MLEEIKTIETQAICLHDGEAVLKALDQMATAINQTLHDQNPLVLCVINGGIIATGQLLPRLTFPLTLDSIHASRYRNQTSGSDEIHWLFTPTTPLTDRTVLVVDDILDQGITLAAIIDWCQQQGAAKVYSAVLVEKQLAIAKPVSADFVGLETADHYLFGSGMDYKAYLRNANGIFACKEVL